MYLSLKSTKKDRIIYGSVFCVLTSLTLASIQFLIARPFSFLPLTVSLILMCFSSLSFFYFWRIGFCPIVQIYKEEVIISRVKRLGIPMQSIKELEVDHRYFKVQFNENGRDFSLKISCSHSYDDKYLHQVQRFVKTGTFGEPCIAHEEEEIIS